MEAINVCVLIS